MASIRVPEGALGPCRWCQHADCRALREVMTSRCGYCGDLILHRLYYEGQIAGDYLHAECFESALRETMTA